MIGPKRHSALLRHYSSTNQLRAASLEELAQVPGLGERATLPHRSRQCRPAPAPRAPRLELDAPSEGCFRSHHSRTSSPSRWTLPVRHQGFDPTGLIPIQHDPPSRHQGICSGQNGISAPCCDHLLRPPPRQGWTSQPLKANLMEGLQHKVRTLQVSSEPPAQASPQPKSLFIQPLARFQLPPQPPDLQHPLHPLTDTSNQSQALPALALAPSSSEPS